MPKRVTTLILNWNGVVDTMRCVRSCQKLRYSAQEIVVIDNGSQDGSERRLRREMPEVKVLQTGDNLGYAGGNNVGFRYALESGADFVLVLNNDTLVAPEMLAELVSAAEKHPAAGVLSPVVFAGTEGDTIWYAGTLWDESRKAFKRKAGGERLQCADLGQEPQSTLSMAGCGFLMPVSVLRHVGGFDEAFFLYWEEMDLSWRVRSAGHEILVVPQATMWHQVGQTFRSLGNKGATTAAYYKVRNRLLWARKHLRGVNRLHFMLYTARLLVPRMGCRWLTHAPGLKPTYWHWRECAKTLVDVVVGPRTRAALHGVTDYFRGRFNARSV